MKKKENPQLLNLYEMKRVHGKMADFDIYVEKHYFDEYGKHSHSFFEIELIIMDEMECIVNGKKYYMKQGEMIFLKPGDVHELKSINNKKVCVITVAFESNTFLGKFDLFKIQNVTWRVNENIQNLFYELFKERDINDEYTNLMLYDILEHIIVFILRNSSVSQSKKSERGITFALGYIRENFSEQVTLEEISNQCGYSVAHFSKKFKSVTGKTFVEYLNDVRLNYAVNILSNSNVRITDLAFDCGFGSVRNFNREFRKKYGCSPNEYGKK